VTGPAPDDGGVAEPVAEAQAEGEVSYDGPSAPGATALPRPAGWIDWAAEEAGGWRLGGWMAMPRGGGFDTVRARWNGADLGVAEAAGRPELAGHLYWLRGPRRFGISVVVPGRDADGRLELTGERGGRPAAAMATTFIAAHLERAPLPPRPLTERASDLAGEAFRLSGLKCFTDVWDELRRRALDPTAARVLDWGCGCGRLVRYLERAGVRELTGCDIDGAAVAWCAANLAGRFVRSNRNPPLPFEDASFDAVIASSVFTHLGREDQRRWLDELRRVIRPGGTLLASFAGEYAYSLGSSRLLSPGHTPGSPIARAVELRKRLALRRAGIIDHFADDHLAGIAPAGYYRGVYQSRANVASASAGGFGLIDYIERGFAGHLDLAVLEAA
jgi:SAM-dependent methyltransferase